MRTYARTTKAKITLTLSSDVVCQLDALARAPQSRSRSHLVEEALRRWLDERVQENIERQTEEYYGSLSPAEREQDREWAALAAEAARQLWDK
jgi:metal-responsive CopG/Arc/MetJ family transcriptional regulator